MRSGTPALGVLAGVLLGLGVVALSATSFVPFGALHVPSTSNDLYTLRQASTTTGTNSVPAAGSASNSTKTATSETTSGSAQYLQIESNGPAGGSSPLYSRLDSIAQQPVTLTGFVLLPIFMAFLFGFVLYRASRGRGDEVTGST